MLGEVWKRTLLQVLYNFLNLQSPVAATVLKHKLAASAGEPIHCVTTKSRDDSGMLHPAIEREFLDERRLLIKVAVTDPLGSTKYTMPCQVSRLGPSSHTRKSTSCCLLSRGSSPRPPGIPLDKPSSVALEFTSLIKTRLERMGFESCAMPLCCSWGLYLFPACRPASSIPRR